MAHIYKYYSSLFKRLNIINYQTVYPKIIQEDFEFYMNYANFGGTKQSTKKFKYSNGKYTFIIHQDIDSEHITFSIMCDDIDIYMLMFIPINKNYVYLQSINYYENCSFPEMPKTNEGTLLLKTTLNFIKSIKDRYNLKYVQLMDNSVFNCKTDKQNTPLSNLSMLTRGHTWYGKYGFVPFDTINETLDIDGIVNYRLK